MTFTTRPGILGTFGVVASPHWIASAVGMSMLGKGGNAFDAAGALNSVPPKQYSILLDGVADIVFALPGYTGDTFPMTNVITLPGGLR